MVESVPLAGVGVSTSEAGARCAALIDLDNLIIVRGQLLRPSAAAPVLAAIDAHVEGMPARAACGRGILTAYMSALAARGWGLTPVPATPDAADRVLFEDGLGFAARGATDLVVVSGDGFFADLASVARLHVMAPRFSLSQRLRLAATTVTYLPRPDRAGGGVAA
jgi:hypothetical protein